MEWLNEYEKLVIRMDTPKVVIDNAACPTATLVQVRLPSTSIWFFFFDFGRGD